MVRFHLLTSIFISLILIHNTNPSKEIRADDAEESKRVAVRIPGENIGPNFHSDLNLLPQQSQMLYGVKVLKRETFDYYKWPKDGNAGLVNVPYRVSRTSYFSPDQVGLIRSAMDEIERETCVRFRPRTYEKDFIHIFSGLHCKSNLGRTGGPQELSLNTFKCFTKGVIMHELLHALGFIHMHNRPDRDKYVKILWKNIEPRFVREFDKVNPSMYNYYGTAYDYHSIMHYGPKAATRNGQLTLIARDDLYQSAIGQRVRLSEGDITRINAKYKCTKVYKPTFPKYEDHRSNHLNIVDKNNLNSFKPTFGNRPITYSTFNTDSYEAASSEEESDEFFDI